MHFPSDNQLECIHLMPGIVPPRAYKERGHATPISDSIAGEIKSVTKIVTELLVYRGYWGSILRI